MKLLLLACCAIFFVGIASIVGFVGVKGVPDNLPWPFSSEETHHQSGSPAETVHVEARYEMCYPETGSVALIPSGADDTYVSLGWCYGTCPCASVPVDPEAVRKCLPGWFLVCDQDDEPSCQNTVPSVEHVSASVSGELQCYKTRSGDGQITRGAKVCPRVNVCHIPQGETTNVRTLSVAISSVPAHVVNGDCVGLCPCFNCSVLPDPFWEPCPPVTERTDCLGPSCIQAVAPPKTNCTVTPNVTSCSLCPFNSSLCPPPLPNEDVNCTTLECGACAVFPECVFCASNAYGGGGTCLFNGNNTDTCARVLSSSLDTYRCFTTPPPPPTNCTELGCADCALAEECVFCSNHAHGDSGVCLFSVDDLSECVDVREGILGAAICYSPPMFNCSTLTSCSDCTHAMGCTFCASAQYGGSGVCQSDFANASSCERLLEGTHATDECFAAPPAECNTLDCQTCMLRPDCGFCFNDQLSVAGHCDDILVLAANGTCNRTGIYGSDSLEVCFVAPPPPPVPCSSLDCLACAANPLCGFCADQAYGDAGLCVDIDHLGDTNCTREITVVVSQCFTQPPCIGNCSALNLTEVCPPAPPADCSALDCAACAVTNGCSFCFDADSGPTGVCSSNTTNLVCNRTTDTDASMCFVAHSNCTDCSGPAEPVVCDVLDCDACQHAPGCQFCFSDAFGGAGACMNETLATDNCARASQGTPSTCYVPQPTNCTAQPVNCSALDCAACNLDSSCVFCASGPFGSAGVCQDSVSDCSTCNRTFSQNASQCFTQEPVPVDCPVDCPPEPTNCLVDCPPEPANCSVDCPPEPTNCTSDCPPPPVDCEVECPAPATNCSVLGCVECAAAPECSYCFSDSYGSVGQCYENANLPNGTCQRTTQSDVGECFYLPPVVCNGTNSTCGALSVANETFCAVLIPVIHCVRPNGSDLVAYWGYYSGSPDPVNVPVGSENMFESPSPSFLGQPDMFDPGYQSAVFTTALMVGEEQSWMLGYPGHGVQGVAIANDQTPVCSDCSAVTECGECAAAVGCVWCDGVCVDGVGDAPLEPSLVCETTNQCVCPMPTCGDVSACGVCVLTPGCVWCNSTSACVSSEADDAVTCPEIVDGVAQCSDVVIELDSKDVENLREEICCTDTPRGWLTALVLTALGGGLFLLLMLFVLLGWVLYSWGPRNKSD